VQISSEKQNKKKQKRKKKKKTVDHSNNRESASANNDMVTREIKLFQNYFSPRRRPTEIILFQRVKKNLPEIISKLSPKLIYCSSRTFSNIFSVAEIISK